jgi:5-methylcytosine-specific restriction endonuclease McrA
MPNRTPKVIKQQVWYYWIGKEIGTTKCFCCNFNDITQLEFHCGHIISESTGGETTVENLRPICAQCNLSMGAMNMNQFINIYFK